MSLVVVDLEWNQSSTGREPSVAKLPFEILQAGFGVVVSLALCAPSSAISHAFRRYAQ